MVLAILLTEDFKLTDWLIVIFTSVLTVVAIKQYLLGKSQDEHYENSERAWLLIGLGWFDKGPNVKVNDSISEQQPGTSTQLVPKLTIRNEGKIPAFIDVIRAKVIVRDAFEETDLPKESEFKACGTLEPIGAGKEASRALQLYYSRRKPHENSYSIHVRVEYHDIFNVKRLSTTAYVTDSANNLYKQEAFRSWHLNT